MQLKMMAFLLLAFCGVDLNAQKADELRKKEFNLGENGLALQGYDAVSYFTKGKAEKGSRQYAVSYQGALYYFSSAENKSLFLAKPAQYEPQYGGWCAYAMGATGEKVEIDPETFKVQQGKLYLFYHTWVNNTLPKWNKDETNLKVKADANWGKIYR
jgi:YHS domain-containing protein